MVANSNHYGDRFFPESVEEAIMMLCALLVFLTAFMAVAVGSIFLGNKDK